MSRPMMIGSVLLYLGLGGCTLAAIPLNAALTGTVANNATQSAEAIPNMNCSQLRQHWKSLQNPLTMLNPTRLTSAERSLVRQTAARRGCNLG